MAKPAIPEVVSHLDPHRVSLDWLDRIAQRAQAWLDGDHGRVEAVHLHEVLRYAALARDAITAGSAAGAALATMGVMQHAWWAELMLGRAIIRAGVGTKRGGAKGGSASGKARGGETSKRAIIEALLREYKGKPDARIATIAKRAGASEAYVRAIVREQAKK